MSARALGHGGVPIAPVRRLRTWRWLIALPILSFSGVLRANPADERQLIALRTEPRKIAHEQEVRLNTAKALIAAGKLEEAIEALESAAPSREVVLLRSKASLWAGKPERARALIEHAPEAVRRATDTRILLSEVLEALGKIREAKTNIDAVLDEVDSHADALAIAARLRQRLIDATDTPRLERVALLAESRAKASAPEARAGAEALLKQELSQLPKEQRGAGLEAAEKHWPKDAPRERALLDAQRQWEDFPGAFHRAQSIVQLEPEAQDVRAVLGDLACGAAWSLLGQKQPAQARDIGVSVTPEAERPSCLLLAMGHASMALADYRSATAAFGSLSHREPENKDALLGSAQAALSANDFEGAEIAISSLEKLPGSDPKQTNGLRLDRYVRGANAALQKNQPAEGERWSRQALTLDEKSIEGSLLLSSALQIQRRFDEAGVVLTRALEHNPRSPRLLGSLARVPDDRDHAALARRGIALLDAEPAEVQFDVQLSLGDALVLDGKLDEAEQEFARFGRLHPESQIPQLRLAQVSMRRGDFFLARDQIKGALAQDRSFSALLSLADANHALNMEAEALDHGRAALQLQPGQPDAVGFLDRLEFAHAPVTSARLMHSWDNGTNQAWEYGVSGATDLNPDLRATADASIREVVNGAAGDSASVVGVKLGLNHQLTRRVAVSGALGLSQFRSETADAGIAPWAMARSDFRIGTAHRLAIEYQADTFSYTAGMVDDHLGLHTLAAISYGPIIPWVSYYTNFSAAELTDGNERGLMFASLYSDLVNQPVVKTGLNGQLIGFSETSLRSYFSPSQLVNTEAFAEILADNVDDTLIYGALGAVGLQWIEERAQQKTYRVSARIGVRPWRSFKVVAQGQTSSSATTNISGFEYYELGATAQVTLY